VKTLIVFAHNEPHSFNAAMKDLGLRTLKDLGHEVMVSDLYAMKFKAVADADDFTARAHPHYLVYALEQRHGYSSKTLAPDILAEVEKVLWADLIIFNFPIYWFSVPAILKGWFDRIFLSGPIYGGMRFYDQGGLKGKSALIAASLGGRPHMFGPNSIHGEIELMLRPILRGTLAYVGLRVLPPFLAYHVPYVTPEERELYLIRYRDHLKNIENLKPLIFPSLDEFDERLFPKKKGERI